MDPGPAALLGLMLALGCGGALGSGDDDLRDQEDVVFVGQIAGAADLSAVDVRGEWMLVAADEGGHIQVLRKTGAREWLLYRRVALDPDDATVERDLEALCIHEANCWALGSHALRRRRLDDRLSVEQNRDLLSGIVHDRDRNGLFHFELDDEGRAGPVSRVDLQPILRRDPVIGAFVTIPSKENGLDLEALAWRDGRLWVGMRGPVLRGDLAVVMVFEPDAPEDYELRYLDLGGFGIRALSRVSDGFVGIAGPMGSHDEEHVLFHWTGEDGLPGSDRPEKVVEVLCELPSPKGGYAEGLSVLEEKDDRLRLLVVHDGAEGGRPREYELRR